MQLPFVGDWRDRVTVRLLRDVRIIFGVGPDRRGE